MAAWFYAAWALRNLALNADNRVAIAQAGGIVPLVELTAAAGALLYAAATLWALALNADNRVAIACYHLPIVFWLFLLAYGFVWVCLLLACFWLLRAVVACCHSLANGSGYKRIKDPPPPPPPPPLPPPAPTVEQREAELPTVEQREAELREAEQREAELREAELREAAAEELRRRATALGLLQVLATANISDDATLKKSIAFCDEHGVTNVSDMVESGLVDDFVRHLGLRTIPERRLRSTLQPPTSRRAQISNRTWPGAGLAAQLSGRLVPPSSSRKPSAESVAPPPPPLTLATSLATSRFVNIYNQPERRPDQLYALMTTERH